MVNQKNVRFLFLTFSAFVLCLVNISNAWAIRNENEPLPGRSQADSHKTRISSKAIVTSTKISTPDLSKLITQEKKLQKSPKLLIRDLRDLSKLQTVLDGKPKT